MSNYTFCIQDLIHNDKLLTMNKENKTLEFKSEDIRHQAIGYFVLNCLLSDEDYKNYIQLSSFDSLFDYVRTLGYEGEKQEKCVFIPNRMEETLTRKIGIDILRHATVEDSWMKSIVCDTLNIPEEILYWDYDARCRYIECAKKGTQTIHRSRAMIVGCAGAGKTTLLKRLQKRSLDELQQVQSTVGLEVHEDIFEILEDKYFLTAVTEETEKEEKQLLSVMDFGGQCAYYACHQVYLSRRAFYLLVIDMSKSFGEKVDPALCEQEGTMFSDWTYGEYILFWLKSVHTYCESNAPVVIIGTHFEKVKGQNSDTFYNEILDHLQFNKHLKGHLERKRCFVLGFHTDGTPFYDTLSDLEKCIIEIAREEKWKENIPTDWALCEVVFRELRKHGSKMITVKELSNRCFGENEAKSAQIKDVLKFYHDIGVILYFNEAALSDTVILDIQWFIDSFKNIITDPNHVRDFAENRRDWMDFYTSGHILDTLLTNIWRLKNFELDFWNRYKHKEHLLQYMERLGLIAVGTVAHYIPCTNKRTFGSAEENYFHSLEYKTPVLVFRFEFLPYFIYFRLIVSCLTRTNREWRVLQDNGLCLYKNIACFAYKQHAVALAVNPSSIQLQVFQPTNTPVTKNIVLEVRNIITDLLNDLLENFHKKIDMYTVGFQCSKQEVFHEHDDCFVKEEELLKKGTMLCPKHELNNSHILSESVLLFYWNVDVLAESIDPDSLVQKGSYGKHSEPEMKTCSFQCFEKLTKIGREALQRYFDKVFPPAELFMLLQKEKSNLSRQFNTDQCDLLYPVDKSIPTSSAFDVTLMYKLLRNYGPNLPTPTKGWGKTPEPGKKTPTDDVERIRVYRNEAEHKTPSTSVMEKEECRVKWRDLCQAILRLSEGSLEQDIMELMY
ncbi:probable serine/threonine-protein kinase pats1 isoform X2 [Saccostrea cucullata]|uniref:probable serine/threonine-protein kinase pats1 isoform X2 n=1 Tax=Saccostrea cuccullata TaxID=36930 RepID=UPI002ED67ADE